MTLGPEEFAAQLLKSLEIPLDPQVSLDSMLEDDLGFDSLQMLEAFVVLEEMLERPLGDDDLGEVSRFGSIRDFYEYYLVHDSMPQDGPTASYSGSSMRGKLVELTPPMGQHYSHLYQIAVANDIAWRWRYGGAIPNYDDFLRTFSSGVLSQLVITKLRDTHPQGLTVAYNANLQNRTAYLAVVIAPEMVGSGAGAEAAVLFLRYIFGTWDFVKVYMEVPEFNFDQFASGLGKVFVCEGTLKQHAYHAGKRWDQYILAIYRDEFTTRWPMQGSRDPLSILNDTGGDSCERAHDVA